MLLASVPMKINSEKKHSVRYDAIDKDVALQSVYVMKTSLPNPIPQELIIIVELPKKD
jgi:hypothetical protein